MKRRHRRPRSPLDQCRTWEEVLALGQWVNCGNCGHRQFHKGDITKKACRKCRALLAQVAL